MPIPGSSTVQDSFCSCDQVSIHSTDQKWYDQKCELRFPRFLPSSWYRIRLPHEWDDHAPDVLTWDCRGLDHLFNTFSEYCHQIDGLLIGTRFYGPNGSLVSKSLVSIMPSSDLQRQIAHFLMQWAFPGVLETDRYLSGHPFLVIVSLKSKGVVGEKVLN